MMKILARGKERKGVCYSNEDTWPRVSVVMSVYNEESVIAQKLDSLLALDYERGPLEVFIGSDCSADRTNEIVSGYAQKYPHIHFFPFTERRGKPGVINQLVEIITDRNPAALDHIYLLTDANVILKKDILLKLIRHFKDEEIMLVDANMISVGVRAEGISKSEDTYVTREVMLKHKEGLLWGTMIGPFGGCYSLRSDHYHPVPPRYLVDDFYITMKAFEQGGKAINDLEAECYEAVSHEIKEEYRRKSRISAGNFQNLRTFRHLLKFPFDHLGFAFFSHKVLRWFGPFLILLTFMTAMLLSLKGNLFYLWMLIFQGIILFVIPMADTLLKSLNINILPFRSITYFNIMNLALLEGYFKYLKGIKNNVWEPPKRVN